MKRPDYLIPSTEFPKEVFYLGRELPNRNLELYATTFVALHRPAITPVIYFSQDNALEKAEELNKELQEELQWAVYRAPFEKVEIPIPTR